MYFQYTVNPDDDEPIMLLNKQIGNDEDGYGIQGDLFQQELLWLDTMGKKSIQIWINCPGGSVTEGFNINSAILNSKTPVDTYCVGLAASMAGVLFQSGRKRKMADYGILMYHDANGVDDNAILKAYRNSLITSIVAKSGKTADEVGKMMARETWINAEDAYNGGLCDEIINSVDLNKKHWKQVANSNDSQLIWKESNKILNNLFKIKDMAFPKVTNKLKLNADANEDSILSAIEGIENSVTKAHTELTAAKTEVEVLNKSKKDLEEQMKNAKAAYDKLKAEHDKMKNDMDDAANKAKEVENKAKLEKATNMVNEAAKVGRIKNEAPVIEKWVKLASEDFDGTKAMIDALPLNKQAAKIENSFKPSDVVDGTKVYNAAGRMAQIAAKHKQS